MARHDAEPIRPAAVAPTARHLLVALIAVGDVQAQGMVVGAFLRDAIVAVDQAASSTPVPSSTLPCSRALCSRSVSNA